MATIDDFMSAIMAQESGGRSQVANKRTGAHGLFQIMPSNWAPWSREAGLGSNAPKTAENQRKVARFKMQQYYNNYGSWDLVAAAWFGGPGAASKLKSGDKSVLNRSDGNMTIGQYIAKMNRGMGSGAGKTNVSPQAGSNKAFNLDRSIGAQGPRRADEHELVNPLTDSEEMWRTVLSTLADQVAGGAREPLEGYNPDDGLGMDEDDDGLNIMPASKTVNVDPAAMVNEYIGVGGGGDPLDAEFGGGGGLLPQPGGAGTNTATRIPALGDLGNVVPGKNGVPKGLRSNAAKGAAAARQFLQFTGEMHGKGPRPNKSDHPDGNAIDLMTYDDIKQGQLISDFYVKYAKELGVKYVIFNRTIWSASNGWKPRRMADRGSKTANHVDHPHISFY